MTFWRSHDRSVTTKSTAAHATRLVMVMMMMSQLVCDDAMMLHENELKEVESVINAVAVLLCCMVSSTCECVFDVFPLHAPPQSHSSVPRHTHAFARNKQSGAFH